MCPLGAPLRHIVPSHTGTHAVVFAVCTRSLSPSLVERQQVVGICQPKHTANAHGRVGPRNAAAQTSSPRRLARPTRPIAFMADRQALSVPISRSCWRRRWSTRLVWPASGLVSSLARWLAGRPRSQPASQPLGLASMRARCSLASPGFQSADVWPARSLSRLALAGRESETPWRALVASPLTQPHPAGRAQTREGSPTGRPYESPAVGPRQRSRSGSPVAKIAPNGRPATREQSSLASRRHCRLARPTERQLAGE